MDTGEIDRTLQAYAEAKNHHDVRAILALCADDCFYESVPLGGRVDGKEGLEAFYTQLFAGLEDYYGDFDGTAFGKDSAVVWGRFGGTLSDEFMGIPVEAGRQIEIPVTFVCTFRDGLLSGDTGYFDVATLCEQAGVPIEAVRPSAQPSGPGEATSFVERFRDFWRHPSADLVPSMVAPDAVANWPGTGTISGTEYPGHIAGILNLVPDLRLEVTDHAESAHTAFISWTAHATAGEEKLEWSGIDRFQIRDGLAVDVFVSYDTAPLQEAIERMSAIAV